MPSLLVVFGGRLMVLSQRSPLIVETPNRLRTNRGHLQTGNWSTIDGLGHDLCAGLE
jgi:hypothetical protein